MTPGPTRATGMFAWIRNTQTESEFWAFKCRWGVLEEGRSSRFYGAALAQGTKGLYHGWGCPRLDSGSEGR